MFDKMQKILELIKRLCDNKKSCQIRLNLHKGDLSSKVEIKESIDLE